MNLSPPSGHRSDEKLSSRRYEVERFGSQAGLQHAMQAGLGNGELREVGPNAGFPAPFLGACVGGPPETIAEGQMVV